MPCPSTNQNVHSADDSSLDAGGARALRRGLQLLDALLDAGPEGLRVVELCRACALERATVHRLLATLQAAGYVAAAERFRYAPGPRLGRAAAATGQPNMAVRLQPVLARVSAAFGDAAFAIVRDGPHSHCIARQVGTHPVQVLVIQVGTRQPLGVGAAGLALLSALPDAQVQQIVAANAPQLGAYGGMTAERMHLLVRATRERGWSVIGNHATAGVLAVGLSVPDGQGRPAAGISVASTQMRMTRERQHQIADLMRHTLRRLCPRGLTL